LNKRTLDNGWQWFKRTDMLFRTSMVAIQTATARIPGSTKFNLHTGLRKNNLEFTLWVNNLLNDKAPASAVFISSPATIFEFATRQRPGRQLFQPLVTAPELRSFGIDVSYDF